MDKIHKQDYLFRVIVSSINSPLYFFALYVHKIMSTSIYKLSSILYW